MVFVQIAEPVSDEDVEYFLVVLQNLWF